MIQTIRDQNIKLMLVASYFEKNSPRMIEDKTGIATITFNEVDLDTAQML